MSPPPPARVMHLRHLAQADRHVAQAERHITEQENRIAKLARQGLDTTEARKLLDNFHASHAEYIRHRERIIEELKE